jgi:ABC-type transporter Mla subunit MlaD
MMKAILGTLSGFALIAFSYLCITLAITARTTGKHLSAAMMKVGDTVTRVNTTLDKINGKGGTLQQTTETIVRVKDLITLSQVTLQKQQKSIAQFDNEMDVLSDNVNSAVQETRDNANALSHSAVNTMQFANDALVGIQNDTVEVHTDLVTLNAATANINAMLPDIQATAKNVNGMTADGKETTAMAKDWLHGILHPTWATRIKNAMLDVLQHLPVP